MNAMPDAPFLLGHATHPEPGMALALAAAQLEAQRAERPGFQPTLGLLYITDAYADQAEALLADVQARWPGVSVVGGTGIGVAATGVEYFDEPGLALMLTDLPRDSFSLFNGTRPLADPQAWTALVHADPQTHDLAELVHELAERTGARYLFGGLTSGRGRAPQFADGVFDGGLSGVALRAEVAVVSRVTQGCQPIGPQRQVTDAEGNIALALDGQPALGLLLTDLGERSDGASLSATVLQKMRGTLVGLSDPGDDARGRGGDFGTDTRVRSLIGIDPTREAVAVGDQLQPGMGLSFCARNQAAARRDLVRICTEIREEVEAGSEVAETLPGAADALPQRRVAGAVYVSCTGRGGPHFGAPSAELQIVRQALGDVPLVGFFAAGEIARHHLYGYTGVLTVFLAGAAG